jgi:hypothetical protein
VSISVVVYFFVIVECELGRAWKVIRHRDIVSG